MDLDKAIELKKQLQTEVSQTVLFTQSPMSTDDLIIASEFKIERMIRMLEELKEAMK